MWRLRRVRTRVMFSKAAVLSRLPEIIRLRRTTTSISRIQQIMQRPDWLTAYSCCRHMKEWEHLQTLARQTGATTSRIIRMWRASSPTGQQKPRRLGERVLPTGFLLPVLEHIILRLIISGRVSRQMLNHVLMGVLLSNLVHQGN